MIVVACNTASAAAMEVLGRDLLGGGGGCDPPQCRGGLGKTEAPIGVIATEATVDAGAYQRAITAIDPTREVAAVAARCWCRSSRKAGARTTPSCSTCWATTFANFSGFGRGR